jgi:putative N6-adenine-specific DNA methylase
MNKEGLTTRGLERRIKRRLTSREQTFAVVATPGLERITCAEIQEIENPPEIRVENGLLEFEAPFDAVYRLNLKLRTASRLLMRVGSFTARSYPELFNKLQRISWEIYTGFHPDIAFTATSRQSRLHHTGVITGTASEAVETYLQKLGVVKIIAKNSAHTVHLRLHNDRCTVSMDTTGTLLHKRGYRTDVGGAPLRETAAAALLVASRWERYPVIADPCCGTGAIIAEALRMADGTDAGSARPFAFHSWPSFSEPHWNHLKNRTREAPAATNRRFFAGDNSEKAVTAAERTFAALTSSLKPVVRCGDCLEFNADDAYGKKGLLISNLPFGKRIGTGEGVRRFYTDLGNALRKNCPGWSFGFLSADPHFERYFGVRCKTTLEFSHGGIAVRYCTGRIPSST